MGQPTKFSQALSDYNPEQYLKQLIIVRDAYNSGKLDDHPTSYDTAYIVTYIGVFCAIIGVAFAGKQWLILGLAILFVVMKLISAIKNGNDVDSYNEAIISTHLNAGFTRTQATEFIYDLDWDDIQYSEDRLDYIKENIENAKN